MGSRLTLSLCTKIMKCKQSVESMGHQTSPSVTGQCEQPNVVYGGERGGLSDNRE